MMAILPLNIVQLTMREGTLSLRQPMRVQVPVDPNLMSNLREFLNQEQAETVFFHAKNPQQNIRAELSETDFRWMEKSPYGTQSFLFSFETKALLYNNQPAESSFCLAFSKKLEDFARDLKNDKLRIFIKPKGGTL